MSRNVVTEEDVFLTLSQASACINVSVTTLKKMIELRNIRTLRTPGGHYRIRKVDLLQSI